MSSTHYPPPPTPPSILVARQHRMEAEAAAQVNEDRPLVIRWDRIIGSIALGVIVGLTITVGLLIGEAGSTVRSGDRVCVAMLGEDGEPVPEAYYCGPVVLTSHDSIAGQDRP